MHLSLRWGFGSGKMPGLPINRYRHRAGQDAPPTGCGSAALARSRPTGAVRGTLLEDQHFACGGIIACK